MRPKFAQKKKADAAYQATPESFTQGRAAFEVAGSVVPEQNERLVELWQKLPWRVQKQVWVHLRHYLHSTLGRFLAG